MNYTTSSLRTVLYSFSMQPNLMTSMVVINTYTVRMTMAIAIRFLVKNSIIFPKIGQIDMSHHSQNT